MNGSSIQPEQAWQVVLDQLRMDMSMGSFNSWVRDTVFVAFEDDILTVGTTNTYGCEWLTSRLTSTVNRMLSGILNQPVAVQFVVLLNEESELAEDDSTENGESESDIPPKVINLQAEYQSVYDEIVQPEHVIVFPGYFLRYIPLLGQELSWLYIGFRQAAYEAGASKRPGKKVGAPAKKVAWYAGMSPRTFWRWAAKPTTWKLLGRLVKPVDEKPQWHRGSDGRPHQATRTYRVSMTIPLTPFDELSLRAWIYPKLAEGKNPLAVLRTALETPIDELLPWPERMPSLAEIDSEPHSVRDVLHAVCDPIPENEQAQFNELADQLVQHLMPPKNLVFLTHYFVSRWLPRLGPGPGWFVTLMRDRCYINQRTGEIRDEVRLDQGYAEAARWLGVKRVKTLWEWLRSPEVATFVRETDREIGRWEDAPRIFKVCMGEPMIETDQDRANLILANRPVGASDTHNTLVENNPIGASVTLSETQMDAAIGGSDIHSGASVTHSEANCEGVGATDTLSGANDTHSGGSDSHNGASVTLRDENYEAPVGVSDIHSGANDTHSDANSEDIGANGIHSGGSVIHNGGSDTLSKENREAAIGGTDTHSGAIDSHNGASVTDERGASDIHIGANDTHNGASVTIDWRNWHSLNSLTPGFKHLKNNGTTSCADDRLNLVDSSSETKDGVVALQWNLKDLLTLNRVSPKNQEVLLEKGLMAQTFISWLLYAASKNGGGIRDSIGHAVSRLVQDPTRGAGGVYDRLAKLPANELAELIKRELSGQSPWNTDWRDVMADTPMARLRVLADQLGVPVSDPNYW